MALLDQIQLYAKSIQINDYPIVGQQFSRNRSITTVQGSPRVWSFVMDATSPILRWDEIRELIEAIKTVNMSQPFSFTLKGSNLEVLTRYQGVLSADQLATLKVVSSSGNTLTISAPAGIVGIFRPGDYIQVGNAVRTVTSIVSSGSGGTAMVPLSEVFSTPPAANTPVIVGSDVVWNNCYFTDLPKPSLGSESINGVVWSGSFAFTQTRS